MASGFDHDHSTQGLLYGPSSPICYSHCQAVHMRGTMKLEDILNQLKSERSRLNQAISALEGLVSGPIRRQSRPPKSGLTNGPRKRTMSAAARRRIAAAMKARWAERKRG